ncbi:MAG: ImmA/IrrE family metallo-endopeptidase [Fusobacteriaceae bacterium]
MLTLLREFEIKKKAEELLKDQNINNPPVDLNKILKALNIKYFERDLTELNLGEDTEALLLSSDKESFIVINTGVQEKYYGRKNFTVAHEIGHFFLHTKKGIPYVAARRGKNEFVNLEEEEANKFAAHLLMPDSLVEEIFFNVKDLTLKKLSDIFKVSEKAMSKKLDELGLKVYV